MLTSPSPTARFEILGVAASGAYGTVCLALLHEPGVRSRRVAIKALKRAHMDTPNVVRRSRDEARVLMRLRHAQIVAVERLVHIKRHPVLVMEWVDGATLHELLADLPDGMDPRVAFEIARQTAVALEYAYLAPVGDDGGPIHVVHRDIKPANILVSAEGAVKVVDFGTARGAFDEREASTVATMMGSMGYLAPERLLNAPDSPAVDVYALGVVLIELLTRSCPALTRNPAAHDIALAGALAELPLPAAARGQRAAIVDLLGRMASAHRDRRPELRQVIAELAALVDALGGPPDLAAFADDHVRPVRARAPTVPLTTHPDGAELAYLEGPWDADAPSLAPRDSDHADDQLRSMLANPGWPQRRGELMWLLAVNPSWSAEPFIEVLDATLSTPRWRFWGRPTVDETVMALEMLRYRPIAVVRERAERFARHHRRGVRTAAARLLAACDNPDQVTPSAATR